MRLLLPALLVAVAAAAGTARADCDPAHLSRFSAEAMVADVELRTEAFAALESCAAYARDQHRNTGEIEERILAQVAALAGRTAIASYAADEVPPASPALLALMESAFQHLYPQLQALPPEQNAAAMRAILFALMDKAAVRATGSTP